MSDDPVPGAWHPLYPAGCRGCRTRVRPHHSGGRCVDCVKRTTGQAARVDPWDRDDPRDLAAEERLLRMDDLLERATTPPPPLPPPPPPPPTPAPPPAPPTPAAGPPPARRWAQGYDACIDCGGTARPHSGKGRCTMCAQRHLKAERKGQPAPAPRVVTPAAPPARGAPWATTAACGPAAPQGAAPAPTPAPAPAPVVPVLRPRHLKALLAAACPNCAAALPLPGGVAAVEQPVVVCPDCQASWRLPAPAEWPTLRGEAREARS